MKWIDLNQAAQLESLKEESKKQPVLIFKHSTRCSISSSALNRLERSWNEDDMKSVKPYYLDLISYRDVSNKIQEVFGIQHESPQILLIKDGVCTYCASHMGITYPDVCKNL